MQLSGSGFSDWACFQMRASMPAGAVAKYSRSWSLVGLTRGKHEVTPSALNCVRGDGCCHKKEDNSMAGALCTAPKRH